MDRERAMRALSGETVVPPVDGEPEPQLVRALMQRLRWPRDGSRRPWTVGVAMYGGPDAPWQGVGNVVRSWSASSFCTVWQKLRLPVAVPLEAGVDPAKQPHTIQWKSRWVDADRVARAIFFGHLTDPYP